MEKKNEFNEKNYVYLKECLGVMSFGESFDATLKSKMTLGFKEFELKGETKIDNDKMEYNIKVVKGEPNEKGEIYYSFEQIKATIKKEDGQSYSTDHQLYRSRGFNVDEMHRIAIGRPLYTENQFAGETVGRWHKLDFSTLDEKGNPSMRTYHDKTTHLSLEREIAKLGIPFANEKAKKDFIQDLKMGETPMYTMRQDGILKKLFVEVEPQLGGLAVRDEQGTVVKRTNTHAMELITDDGPGKLKAVKQDNSDTLTKAKEIAEKKPKESKGQGQGQRA